MIQNENLSNLRLASTGTRHVPYLSRVLLFCLAFLFLLGIQALSYAITGDIQLGLVFILLIALGALAFEYPKIGLMFTLGWTIIQYWFTDDFHILPQTAVWLDEALIMIVILSVVIRKALRREPLARANLSRPILLFIAIGLIATIWNQNSLLIGLVGIRGILQYALVFYAIINLELSQREQKRFIGVMIAGAILQIFVTLSQLMLRGGGLGMLPARIMNGISISGEPMGDLTPGTFGLGGANNMGYFLVIVIIFLLGSAIYNNKFRWLSIALALSLFLPWSLASARGSYWMFLLIVAINVLLARIRYVTTRNPAFICVSAIALLVAYIELVPLISRAWDLVVTMQSQPYSPRFLYYGVVYAIVSKSVLRLLIGLGPGMFGSYTAGVFGTYYDRLLRGMFSQGDPVWSTISGDSQILALFAEFGIIGLIVASWLIFAMFRNARQLLLVDRDAWSNVVAVGGLASALIFLFASVLTNAWEVQPIASWIWAFAGLVQLNNNKQEFLVLDPVEKQKTTARKNHVS
ncbi:MAG TPA: hypothetical protein VGK02_05410 [Candidatus Aquicultor sp.]|jgi:hypothetical protein